MIERDASRKGARASQSQAVLRTMWMRGSLSTQLMLLMPLAAPVRGLPAQQPAGGEEPGGVLVLRLRPAASRLRDSSEVRRGSRSPHAE
jgi:hypothetical protein